MQIILDWEKADDGLVARFMFGTLKLQVCRADIVRVIYTRQKELPPAESDVIVTADWPAISFDVEATPGELVLTTDELRVSLSRRHGTLQFRTADGRLLLGERKLMDIRQAQVQGENASNGTLDFDLVDGEGIYGLGQHQHGHLNQRRAWQGPDAQPLHGVQENEAIVIPCYLSTQGYGILLNTYSRLTVTGPGMRIHNQWLLNDAIDYYFMFGPEFDRIVASYRTLTGQAPMFPKWAYGFWQSRCYYDSQAETLGVAKHYRRKAAPLDALVVDYFHWRGGCGSMQFDELNWPDPAAMADALHELNVHLMVSVWPSFQPGNENFDQMRSNGWLLNHPSECFLGRFYDPFDPKAGEAMWRMVRDSHLARGVDAWWLDASEPEDWDGWWKQRVMTAAGPCSRVLNTYSLRHTGYFYHGQRESAPDKRVYILARSSYAGQQRHAAASWSGDIRTDFATFQAQIPAGLNFCAAGVPYWASDIGGFKSTGEWTNESLIRWFQFGVFSPIFRLHGNRDTNEIWSYGEQAEQVMTRFSRFRQRLMPYIYSLAHKVTTQGYTIMRALPFDFREDPKVRDINDQYMFGPALMVNPVTTPDTDHRMVQLPDGANWYDFWTGTRKKGGGGVRAHCPLERLPLYVRAGSILPLGPEAQYVDQHAADPLELRIYGGADASFTLYEDQGDTYSYEDGAFATIELTWNDAEQTLHIGERQGRFDGMLERRTFRITRVGDYHGIDMAPLDDDQVDAVVQYDGAAQTVALGRSEESA